jgi:hypothetical protein
MWLAQHLVGKLFGDKGYLAAPLAAVRHARGGELVTKARKNMAQPLLTMDDASFLRTWSLITASFKRMKEASDNQSGAPTHGHRRA